MKMPWPSLSSPRWIGLFVATIGAVGAIGWIGFHWLFGPANPEQIALGRKLYAEHCASCHGTNLEGQPGWQTPKADGRLPAPPHDATGHTWHHTDRELFLITKKGMAEIVPGYVNDMPAFERVLSDEEITAVLAYIKSTWPRRERTYQEARTRAGPGL
jgi:mono/diheme cytochrome c family protein